MCKTKTKFNFWAGCCLRKPINCDRHSNYSLNIMTMDFSYRILIKNNEEKKINLQRKICIRQPFSHLKSSKKKMRSSYEKL